MVRLLNTMSKDALLDLIAAEEDVPLYRRDILTTTEAGEIYLADATVSAVK